MRESPSPMNQGSSHKRARSPSDDSAGPPSKSARVQSSQLAINYLARQSKHNIALLNSDDTLPAILRLITEYDGVFHRQESLAGNLGACPLGPILVTRFERLFEGPPRILKSNGKDPCVTWLDVVDFARNKPEQFNLEKMRNGLRVCQFYTKQCRVEISEEDYVLINSGMPQKLIPAQPIQQDEEKELGALEIVETNLNQIVQLADQVASRARQLSHKLKNRKCAIVSRKDASNPRREAQSDLPHGILAGSNGNNGTSQSPLVGFTAVNSKLSAPLDGVQAKAPTNSSHPLFSRANTENLTVLNGSYIKGISQEERMELVKGFLVSPDLQSKDEEAGQRTSAGTPKTAAAYPQDSTRSASLGANAAYTSPNLNNTSAVPIPSTPASLLPHLKPTQVERDDGGPYKAAMVTRTESLLRGERIIPPCDRCRRLHMDCLKNLTACMGCTKKHAKCSWKDVREEEVRFLRSSMQSISPLSESGIPAMEGIESTSHDLSPRQSPLLPPLYRPSAHDTSHVHTYTTRRELDLLPPSPSIPSPIAPPPTAMSPISNLFTNLEKKTDHPPYPPLSHTANGAPATTSTPSESLQDSTNGISTGHRPIFSPPLLALGPGRGHVQSHSHSQTPTTYRPTNPISSRHDDHVSNDHGDGNLNNEHEEDEGEGEGEGEGEVDRLQALAAQVYRSASAQRAQQQQAQT